MAEDMTTVETKRMSSSSSTHCHVVLALLVIAVCILFTLRVNFHPKSFLMFQNKPKRFDCFKWERNDRPLSMKNECLNSAQIYSFVWTYDGAGFMKYLQWIATRRLANIKITRLNDDCHIIQENYYSSNSTNEMFIQIYIVSLLGEFADETPCSIKLHEFSNTNIIPLNHIYFKRKSIKATLLYQQLDSMKGNFNTNANLTALVDANAKKANIAAKDFGNHFRKIPSAKSKIIDSEDLIKNKLVNVEKILTDLISYLAFNKSLSQLKNIIEYDSHKFLDDSIWWDRSDVAERILNMSIPSRPLNFTYTDEFYHLHGDRSFTQYLYDNRQCYDDGVFAQMQSETLFNRSSTNHTNSTSEKQSNLCLFKSYDCAFGDVLSFEDREELYQKSSQKPIKCGLAVPSIFDQVRERYARNDTCQTIVFTCITNCYDPLPQVVSVILPSFCFIALVDTKTKNVLEKSPFINANTRWDLIDLGVHATPFRVEAKSTEILKILGQRVFPLAKWIIWADGKGRLNDISETLKEAKTPVMGAPHPDRTRTSTLEVGPTKERVGMYYAPGIKRTGDSLMEISLQEKQYQIDGFYANSDRLGLKMFDIAIFFYRNNHPCTFRYLCGWHNEVNYYSYRGQLSVFYPAVRLNLSHYLSFLQEKSYITYAHRAVC